MSLPKFIIAGAAKAGTSSLYSYINDHPSIFLSDPKELNFFSSDKFDLGLDWYQSNFSGAKKDQLCGEASVSYLPYSDVAVPRIKKVLPNVKLIFMLRNPIDRFYSDYWFNVYRGAIQHKRGQFEKIVSGKFDLPDPGRRDYSFRERLLNKGEYSKHLNVYFNSFNKNQIKIILFEEFINNPNNIIQQVFKFLEIEAEYKNVKSLKVYNETKYPNSSSFILSSIKFIKKITPNIILKNSISVRKKIKSTFYTRSKPPFSIESKRNLLAYYNESIKDLSRLLEKDLNYWCLLDRD